jgi:hypothetical protein
MDSSKANSQEYLRQTIDAEIKSLEESIRRLKRRRNTLAPFLSLPPEISATIFSHVSEKRDRHLAWLRVAHICQQWREIVLNDPLFWNHINFAHLTVAGVAEILSRAKNAPLILEARILYNWWDDARFIAFDKVLQSRVSHIRHLSIRAEAFALLRTLEGLTTPAPNLEYLSLYREGDFTGTVTEGPFVPDALFDGTTPRLFSLELRGCDISCNSPLLKGLRNLEIRRPPEHTSLTEWLDTLDEMPQLKRLVLHSVSLTDSDPFKIGRTATLSSLTHLDISTSANDCALALAHLVLPVLTSLRLTAESQHSTGSDIKNLLLYVVRHFHGTQDNQSLHSVAIRGGEGRADIFGWPDIHVDLHDRLAWEVSLLSARVVLSIKADGRDCYQLPQGILDAAIVTLPLDSLVTLTVQRHTGLDKQFWLRYTPRWPLLQCLRLAPPAAHGFSEMVLDYRGARCPLLPSLTKLDLIDNTKLDRRRTLRLCDVLMERVEQGVPLETLDLRTCRATSYAVQLLSEIVVDVWSPEVHLLKVTESPFIEDDYSETEDYSDDDDDYDLHTSDDDEESEEVIDTEVEEEEDE